MIETIENEFLSISVKKHGAELCSVKSLKNGKEYLWQANEKYWNKHAPILFPIIGLLKDEQYKVNGKVYKMKKHGLARNLDFKVIEKHNDTLKYLLTSDNNTLKQYPFKFELYVIYKLKDNKLEIVYEVKNKDNKEMCFSIGGHPAFNCNMGEANRYLKFQKDENLYSYIINKENGLMEKQKKLILKNKRELLLTYDLFKEQDTLIFDGINSDYICILDDNMDPIAKISVKDFQYLAMWTPEAPFICIEPWYGIGDFVDSNNILKDKIGIQKLDIDKSFMCNYKIEIFNL